MDPLVSILFGVAFAYSGLAQPVLLLFAAFMLFLLPIVICGYIHDAWLDWRRSRAPDPEAWENARWERKMAWVDKQIAKRERRGW